MTSLLGRGLAAGAAGTTVLNLVTYADMAARGRSASDTPERTVDAIADRLGGEVPGKGDVLAARRTGLGALSGILTGLGVGVAASTARSAGLRLPAVLSTVVTGATAMAATDGTMAALGVSDPRTWTAAEWAADAVPHLAYGAAVEAVLRSSEHDRDTSPVLHPRRRRPSVGLVLRSTLLGVASGGRSTLGIAGPAVTTPRSRARAAGTAGSLAAVGALTGEIVLDKLPNTPSRLVAPVFAGRVVAGAGGAAALAGRENAYPALPVVLGAAGAVAGTYLGSACRVRFFEDTPDWQVALAEDAVSIGLALVACLPHRRG